MMGMHWDGSVSIGNVLTLIAMLCAMGIGYAKFIERHTSAITRITAALDNLSLTTGDLKEAVQVQNGRLVKVETALAVEAEVDRRMSRLSARS